MDRLGESLFHGHFHNQHTAKFLEGKWYAKWTKHVPGGAIVLSYWSQGEIPICGTVLLKLTASNRVIKGTWQGYTAKSLKDDIALVSGRAIIARDPADLED